MAQVFFLITYVMQILQSVETRYFEKLSTKLISGYSGFVFAKICIFCLYINNFFQLSLFVSFRAPKMIFILTLESRLSVILIWSMILVTIAWTLQIKLSLICCFLLWWFQCSWIHESTTKHPTKNIFEL